MTNISDLPAELQPAQTKLKSIARPSAPYKRDTVGDSESALDGDSLGGTALYLILAALLPWWADIFLDEGGGADNEEWRDYFAITGIASVGTTWYLFANTDIGFWQSFGLGMAAAVVGLILMVIFHLVVHKCICMFLYNRIGRPGWVSKMRIKDEQEYAAEVQSYPVRLAEYEEAISAARAEAVNALAVYSVSNPHSKKYVLEEHGFAQVSMKDEFIKDFTDGAKGLFKKLVTR
jgi:uncharacterized membrane protein